MGDFRSLVRQTVTNSERKQQEQAILADAKMLEKAQKDAALLASWIKAEIVNCASKGNFENAISESASFPSRIESACRRAPLPLGGYSYSTDTNNTTWGNLAVDELIDNNLPLKISREFAEVEVLEFKKGGLFSGGNDLHWVERFTPSAYYLKFDEIAQMLLKEDGIELKCAFKIVEWYVSGKQGKIERSYVKDLSVPFLLTKERSRKVAVFPIMQYTFQF